MRWLFFVCLLLGMVCQSRVVLPCGNVITDRQSLGVAVSSGARPVVTMQGAEQRLQSGAYALVLSDVRALYPKVRLGSRRSVKFALEPKAPLRARAIRLAAIATIRSKGVHRLRYGKKKLSRSQRLNWAHQVFVSLSKKAPKNTQWRTYLAESFALRPSKRKQAQRMLLALHKKDLIVGAIPYGTLAFLYRRDPVKQLVFLSFCLKRTTHKSLCKVGNQNAWLVQLHQ